MPQTELAYADPAAPAPTLESLGGKVDRQTRLQMLVACSIPLVISAGVQWIFFISYWMPETAGVPGRTFWLNQLAPLASRFITSAGHSQVDAESGWWDVPALILLLCSIAIYALCRTRAFWLGPAGLATPAAVGALVALGSLVALVLGGRLGRSWLTVLLLIAWVGTAVYASMHKIFDDPTDHRAPNLRESLIPLAIYALIGPAPTAVGRMLFGRPLRDMAVDLELNTLTGRLAALVTPTTALLYLCGLLIGVAVWVVWVVWEWWPPRRLTGYPIALAVILIATVTLGWAASSMAGARAAFLRDRSPIGHVRFSCGSVSLDGGNPGVPGRPARTLVISGFSCRTVTTFVGYRQERPGQPLSASTSPLSAHTPEGLTISSRLVAAQYDSALVVAAGGRFDRAPDRLLWFDPVDGHQTGVFLCGPPARSQPLFVRFARVPGGDNQAAGHITEQETKPTVVVNCEGRASAIDPANPPR